MYIVSIQFGGGYNPPIILFEFNSDFHSQIFLENKTKLPTKKWENKKVFK